MTEPIDRATAPDPERLHTRVTEFLQSEVFNRIQRKLVIAFLVVVLLPLLGTALYGNWVTSRALGERAVEAAQADLQQRASQIEGYLAGVRGDVLYLSQTDTLGALINARANGDPRAIADWRGRLAAEFYVFAQTHPMYYQVRYITEDGWEFVRINADHGSVQVVPLDQLQHKSHRYYFTETIDLPRGEIYVSPVDLNREFGQIETPYTPVIRYATPVFYADGRRAGVVIVNLYADEFLWYARADARSHEMVLVEVEHYLASAPRPTSETDVEETDPLPGSDGVRKGLEEMFGTLEEQEEVGSTALRLLNKWDTMSKTWLPGILHCYDIVGLPRHNLKLEGAFGNLRRHQRRVSGRKETPPLRIFGPGEIMVQILDAGEILSWLRSVPPKEYWAQRRKQEEREEPRRWLRRLRRDPEQSMTQVDEQFYEVIKELSGRQRSPP